MKTRSKKKEKLTTGQFVTTLVSLYDGVPDTNFLCRFFLQASTFSYELHDKRKSCFTSNSLVFQSEVYFWRDPEGNQKIVNDILAKAKELSELDTKCVFDVEI